MRHVVMQLALSGQVAPGNRGRRPSGPGGWEARHIGGVVTDEWCEMAHLVMFHLSGKQARGGLVPHRLAAREGRVRTAAAAPGIAADELTRRVRHLRFAGLPRERDWAPYGRMPGVLR
ncbi:hypothetical protein CG747_11305 [Streptomyces sp. CB02959]|uniref:hypothetical protein n=1 Tax=Streptomyces sp. CB02959 TaxID=2020330 RepID=UPI000C279F98|nr:hypothetical protein [Streptomyces sp. CB02959]PJN40894.1 hypothetical protein CG747_11305 [Streptomyces sp. CB02959]